MKTPRLPEIDLARIAPLARERKRFPLDRFQVSRPPHTYNPTRHHIPDLVNATIGFLPAPGREAWSKIESAIRYRCHGEAETKANLQVAEGLYRFADAAKISGRHHVFRPLSLGMFDKVTFWSPVVLDLGQRPTILFVDPRRTKGLTAEARRFVFSAMNEHIRVAEPDLSDARLLILQFNGEEKGPRSVVPYFDDGIELFSYESLDAMVRETYEVLIEVLAERAAKTRRGGTGTFGLS